MVWCVVCGVRCCVWGRGERRVVWCVVCGVMRGVVGGGTRRKVLGGRQAERRPGGRAGRRSGKRSGGCAKMTAINVT